MAMPTLSGIRDAVSRGGSVLADAGRGGLSAYGAASNGIRNLPSRGAGVISNAWHATSSAASGVTGAVSGAWGAVTENRAVKLASKGTGKILIAGGIAAAAIGGLGLVAAIRGKRASESARKLQNIEPQEPEIPQVLTAQELMNQPAGPADGYAPNQWRSTVRGGGRGDIDPIAPKMSAMGDAAIDDLGAANLGHR